MNEGTIAEGQILTGVMFNEPMRVVTTRRSGGGAVIAGMVGQNSGQFREVTLTQDDVANLNAIDPNPSYDGDTIHRAVIKASVTSLTHRSALDASYSLWGIPPPAPPSQWCPGP